MRVIHEHDNGFTLVEVVMVIVILGIITAVAMKSLDSGLEASRVEETRKEMDHLVEAMVGNPNLYSNGVRTNFGYVGDVGSLPPNLDALVTSPGYATWRGPYIQSDFTNFSEDYKRDAWGAVYSYSGGMLSSVGGSDTLRRVIVGATSDLTANSVSGVLTDAGGNPPGDSAARVAIILRYPNGTGGYRDSTLRPNASGAFSFTSCVPVGNHTIKAIYSTTADTVQSFVSVTPKSTATASLRLPGALWAAAGGGGGGGGSSAVSYVTGSVQTFATNSSSIRFDITNTGTQAATVSSIRLDYTKTAYYRYVYWDGAVVFNRNNPRAGNGNVTTFSASKSIFAGQTLRLSVEDFRTTISGGSRVNMAATAITVTFSDGTSINFTTP